MVRLLNFKICNVTGIWDVKFRIRLTDLKEALGNQNCS